MRRAALALLGTIAGLVALLSFKTHTGSSVAAPAAVSTAEPDGATSNPTGAAPSTAPSTGAGAAPSTTKTVTGSAVDTRWGPVQVRITVSNGKLSNVTAVEYPMENPRDQEINAYAIPALNQEAVAAGSANIDMVSGATYTSQGYIGSLQSALDQAGLR